MHDHFGHVVSLSSDGSILAIGAHLNDYGNKTDVGKVQVYKFDEIENIWTQIGNDIRGHDNNDLFGNSISLNSDGSILAVTNGWESSKGIYHQILINFQF